MNAQNAMMTAEAAVTEHDLEQAKAEAGEWMCAGVGSSET